MIERRIIDTVLDQSCNLWSGSGDCAWRPTQQYVAGTPGKRQSLRASFDGNVATKITMDTNCGTIPAKYRRPSVLKLDTRYVKPGEVIVPLTRAITSRYIAVKGD